MTPFWSAWVIGLIVLNLGLSLFLFVWAQRVRIPTAPDGTSGHTWAHGVLREGVRRLPLWWVLLSGAMFAGAFGYLALYPGFGGFGGLLGWTSAGEWQRDTDANRAKLAKVMDALHDGAVEDLADNPAAVSLGRRLFLDNCAACHGAEALGNPAVGAPNLTDADWLYGGDAKTLLATILNGRKGAMPAWGPALGQNGVVDVASYVRSLSGADAPAAWVAAGKARFTALCVGCHGIDGRGNAALGAPNLTDDVWLYGGDFTTVAETIRTGRGGVMPAWRDRLGEDQARAVAAWLYAISSHDTGSARRGDAVAARESSAEAARASSAGTGRGSAAERGGGPGAGTRP
ncbi:MAG TPA: cytochrome-c oxidase, cbb3-type subunit III [Gammaproteobacteria bacterium]|nr:cytochrome-c oxidase, cbb3-type subunit III [Gammaproteobacteria bacterium]